MSAFVSAGGRIVIRPRTMSQHLQVALVERESRIMFRDVPRQACERAPEAAATFGSIFSEPSVPASRAEDRTSSRGAEHDDNEVVNLTYVPLLHVQRELQAIPRGMERFRTYIDTMTDDAGDDLALPPLGIINPMAKDHITDVLDALLAIDADAIGARAAAEASDATADTPGDHKASLVVADELGGWTNRWTWEHDLRFGLKEYRHRVNDGASKRFWITGVLWSGEHHTDASIREAVLTAAYRAAYVKRHGPVRTLRDMLAQEGSVLAEAGCAAPSLDADEIAYTREVVAPVDDTEMRTAVEYLFGDDAARACGFTPRGLSPWAGIALALHDARAGAAQRPPR